MPKSLSGLMGGVMAEMEATHEQESWQKKEETFYRVTVTSAATADTGHRIFGFMREIRGHSIECCKKLPDGSGRTYCKWSNTAISEEEALSLVRKGQGSVYKITQTVQRIK